MLVKRFDLLTNDLCVVYMIVHFREFLRIRSKNDRRSNATMSLMNADEETDQQLQLCVVYFCSLNLNDCIDKKSEEKFDILLFVQLMVNFQSQLYSLENNRQFSLLVSSYR